MVRRRRQMNLLSHEALMQGTEIWRFMSRGKPILRHPRRRFKADNGEALLAAALDWTRSGGAAGFHDRAAHRLAKCSRQIAK